MTPEFGILIVAVLGLLAYMTPTWVAAAREHHQTGAIFVTNLLLGWTLLGWIAALIWASTAVRQPTSANN